MSDRFFHDGPLGPGDFSLSGPEAHHLSAVRRLGPGDPITLFNGDGREYPAQVLAVGKKQVTVQVLRVENPARENGFRIHVAAALPKGDRGDFLIEKLTELGATDFTAIRTDRGIVKADETKSEKLRRAVIEASKQCGRNVLLQVHPPARWLDWCGRQVGRRFIAHPGAVRPLAAPGADSVIAIGPEGGFTDEELQTATAAGWELVSLGRRILRVETAALAAVTILGQELQ